MKISNKKILIANNWIEISPSIYRTAEAICFEKSSIIGSTITIVVRIKHYTDEQCTIIAPAPYEDTNGYLVINNETIVDKTTGQYADENTPEENKQGEFDFFFTQKMFSIEESLNFGIMRADAMNRFD